MVHPGQTSVQRALGLVLALLRHTQQRVLQLGLGLHTDPPVLLGNRLKELLALDKVQSNFAAIVAAPVTLDLGGCCCKVPLPKGPIRLLPRPTGLLPAKVTPETSLYENNLQTNLRVEGIACFSRAASADAGAQSPRERKGRYRKWSTAIAGLRGNISTIECPRTVPESSDMFLRTTNPLQCL